MQFPERSNPLFKSFWQGGYEGADHINGSGIPLDMNESNEHVRYCDADYLRLRSFGIRTVRESIGWRLSHLGSSFDFSHLDARIDAARRRGVQILWTFCHYGWPPGIDVLSEDFVGRFTEFCAAAAAYLADEEPSPIYTPINEISFLSFAIAETGLIYPHCGELREQGFEIKKNLVRAAIAGCDAIRSITPGAKMLHADPLIHIEPADSSAELAIQAALIKTFQFQALDMLCGHLEPQLGGAPRYLDIVGVNHYHSSQWEHPTQGRLHWHLRDSRRQPLHRLLLESYERYRRPLLIAETSHVGSGRGEWINEISEEVHHAWRIGLPIAGICLYPILDRPDWEDPNHWHRSGLWDVADADRPLQRRLAVTYARELSAAQIRLRAAHSAHLPPNTKEFAMPAIIVFSHLRWDFVFQRPQQLMVRLAQHFRIYFVEEPVFTEGHAYSVHYSPHPGICVIKPHTSSRSPGFHDDQISHLQPLLTEFFAEVDTAECLLWLYTPMALPLVTEFFYKTLIYDCMDELRAFKNAPAQLEQRENALLEMADVVFTGGPSLYESRRHLHDNVHCFPSSVDADHFAQAQNPDLDHPEQKDIPHPRLGFFGVIDERFDIPLLTEMADSHPHWQLCVVGPVVKVDPAQLPQRANIHYFGQRSYAELPAFVAGWDVCLLPFARNDSTRFISPTKTLEYMAAAKPVVAIALTDVVELYGHTIYAADGNAQFIAACETALNLSPASLEGLREGMRKTVTKTSWDLTVEQMLPLLQPTVNRSDSYSRALLQHNNLDGEFDHLVLGGGPTGLSAAYHLGASTLLLERYDQVGGNCRSIVDGGYTFDYAGHIMFSNDEYVQQLYQTLLGDNMHWQNREAWIYSKDVYTRYPFQGALYGLPPNVLTDCLVGAIEARFGSLSAAPKAGGAPTEKSGPIAPSRPQAEAENFEEFIFRSWGAGVAEHFAIPYNRKLWTVPLKSVETSWMAGRVPLPNLQEMIAGALEPVPKPVGPNARFGYPLRGGFEALMTAFLPHLKGKVELNSEITRVTPSRCEVETAGGRTYGYRSIISTLALPDLIRLIGDEAPVAVQEAAKGLQHVSVRCVNLGIAREHITDKHWIYYPEDTTLFHRIFVQGNASPHCNPPGGFGLTCEITYSDFKPLPCSGQALIRRCIDDCIAVGIIRADDVVAVANEVDIPYAYVIYDHQRSANVELIKRWLAEHDIIAAGRYAEWEYYNSDHAFLAGRRAAAAAEDILTIASGAIAASGSEVVARLN